MKVLRVGGIYFAVVFAAGFALGIVRVSWIVPQIGTRVAELIEAPIMLAISAIAARWLVRRTRERTGLNFWLKVGTAALGFMLLVEFTFVRWFRGLTLDEYFTNRDPISTPVYFVALGVFAILPLLFSRLQRRGHDVPPHSDVP